jgi:hypothetical protein
VRKKHKRSANRRTYPAAWNAPRAAANHPLSVHQKKTQRGSGLACIRVARSPHHVLPSAPRNSLGNNAVRGGGRRPGQFRCGHYRRRRCTRSLGAGHATEKCFLVPAFSLRQRNMASRPRGRPLQAPCFDEKSDEEEETAGAGKLMRAQRFIRFSSQRSPASRSQLLMLLGVATRRSCMSSMPTTAATWRCRCGALRVAVSSLV